MPRIEKNILPLDLQFTIRRKGFTQRDLSKIFDVTDGAVSGAVNNDPLLKKLRERIINYLNSLQFDNETREVA